MEGAVLLYTVVFVLYSIVEITGTLPQELRSSGLTLCSLFSRYYGDEDVNFISHHIKRTTANIIIHSSLPLVYTIGLQFVYPHFNLLIFWEAPPTVRRLLFVSIVTILVGMSLGVFYSRKRWSNHPLAKSLSQYGSNWGMIASTINAEYRRINKFITEMGPYKVVVTESWIVKCGTHSVQIVRQLNANLKIISSDEQRVDNEGGNTQFLTIQVSSTSPHCTSFNIRLKSQDYSTLQDNVTSPIQLTRQVVIQQSLTDQFLTVFTEQVTSNGVYQLPPGSPPLEPCLGCSQSLPEVKLVKSCAPLNEGTCQNCSCHPMWCLSCMSKWYASRQDQTRPETWLEGGATCPLCRQKFCMLDVLRIEQ